MAEVQQHTAGERKEGGRGERSRRYTESRRERAKAERNSLKTDASCKSE